VLRGDSAVVHLDDDLYDELAVSLGNHITKGHVHVLVLNWNTGFFERYL